VYCHKLGFIKVPLHVCRITNALLMRSDVRAVQVVCTVIFGQLANLRQYMDGDLVTHEEQLVV
jgi:hypothetical protein